MMPYFVYERARTPEEAAAVLAGSGPETKLLAGGTDLVQLLKNRLTSARRLVDIRGLAEHMGGVAVGEGGALRLGALATLAEVAEHPLVRGSYRALAQAAAQSASPQLRNVATLGGNLLQLTRCDYFRSGVRCFLNGGDVCYAAEGEHRRHSIYPRGTSVSVNPSDPATALLALDARVELLNASGETREAPLQELLKDPDHDDPRFLRLGEGEILTAVVLPPADVDSVYVKAMERADWSFALAAVAVAVRRDASGTVEDARVVLGAVAGQPLRDEAAEAALVGRPIDDETIASASEAAASRARPLPGNAYKVELVRGLVREALRML